MKQELINRIKDNINGLSEKKKKCRKVGKLKFKSEVNSIPLIQYKNTYKILDENYVKIQGIKQYIRVRGLSQTPGDIAEKDDFHVGMSHNHKFNIENMKEFDTFEDAMASERQMINTIYKEDIVIITRLQKLYQNGSDSNEFPEATLSKS